MTTVTTAPGTGSGRGGAPPLRDPTSIAGARPPERDGKAGPDLDPDLDDDSPGAAASALALTFGLLAGALVAVWVVAGWPVEGP